VSAWEEVAGRLVDLVKEDAELHDALLYLLEAITETEKAKAEYQRSRIKRVTGGSSPSIETPE